MGENGLLSGDKQAFAGTEKSNGGRMTLKKGGARTDETWAKKFLNHFWGGVGGGGGMREKPAR